ncbi:unnamed protein product [Pleuronectes platessa]|uniref:Uncharacterized protein n=1 Tax=Pleuronectes platessa TaxID=8262 RepID=A0A9N7TM48_PLEPL|nr:unnamed protein product [Pleuronectes platessa]
MISAEEKTAAMQGMTDVGHGTLPISYLLGKDNPDPHITGISVGCLPLRLLKKVDRGTFGERDRDRERDGDGRRGRLRTEAMGELERGTETDKGVERGTEMERRLQRGAETQE